MTLVKGWIIVPLGEVEDKDYSMYLVEDHARSRAAETERVVAVQLEVSNKTAESITDGKS